jgi:signal transduction histidine kinase
VSALAQQLGMSNSIQIELEVDEAEGLTEHAQVAIFQIIREALHHAIRRGPPTRILVRVGEASDSIEAVISDDAPGERRSRDVDTAGARRLA